MILLSKARPMRSCGTINVSAAGSTVNWLESDTFRIKTFCPIGNRWIPNRERETLTCCLFPVHIMLRLHTSLSFFTETGFAIRKICNFERLSNFRTVKWMLYWYHIVTDLLLLAKRCFREVKGRDGTSPSVRLFSLCRRPEQYLRRLSINWRCR